MAKAGDKVHYIRVVNRNPFPIYDRYDGIQYAFPPLEKVTVPVDVATHIFGYKPDASEDDMFRHVQRRFGWNSLAMVQNEQDRMYFDNLDIKPIIYELVEVPLDRDEEPTPPQLDEEREERNPKRRKYKPRKRLLRARVHADDGHPLDVSQPVEGSE
jgi:hypothetical protein